MGWDWGWPIKWCLFWDRSGDFCKFCAFVNRAFVTLILKRNPTFVNWQPAPATHDTEDANYI